MDAVIFQPIGMIHTPYTRLKGMPIQPAGAKGVKGTIEIESQYVEGLKDLSGFSHVFLLYHFHRSEGYSLVVTPFLDKHPHGVFATRAPKRPNAIGLSVVRLLGVSGCTLQIEDADILDGTPLLDIKPYVPEFDGRKEVQIGWLSENIERVESATSGDQFTQ